MLKNMKLGMKIGGGFGILIAISMVLGGLAVVNMQKIKNESTKLAEEYVPEVEVANNVERYSLLTMYNMRGYGFTEEQRYLDGGKTNLGLVKKHLTDATALAEKSEHLVKLKGAVKTVQDMVSEYEGLVEETVERNEKIARLRDTLDENAATYIQNCNSFLQSQNEAMRREFRSKAVIEKLDERLKKITIINDIIDLGNRVRIGNFKAQATREPELLKDMLNVFPKIDKKLNEIRSITRRDENKRQLDVIQEAGSTYKSAMQGYLDNYYVLRDLGKKRDAAAKKVLDESQSIAMAGVEETNDIAHEAVLLLDKSSTTMITGLMIALLIGIVFALVITRAITRPVIECVKLANAVAEGDLTQNIEVQQGDEIGMLAKAIQQMVAKLTNVVTEIKVSADNVAAGSQQMSSTSQSMSQGATEQASSLEEITSSMNEIGSQTKQNAENAGQANKLATDTRNVAEKGNGRMSEMVSAMGEINESSQNISKIIKTIDEIAFQTNLLALNAAVEAARAGKHGKGFAVVAEEVRNLAARSAKAAKETAEMIESSVKKVEDGTEIANGTAEALHEIVESVAKVTDLVGEIAAASNEQAQGVSQITQGLGQIDQVTQQNTSHAEESASASEELASQATMLQQLISTFKVKDDASVSAQSPVRTTGHTQGALPGAEGKAQHRDGSNGDDGQWGGAPGTQVPKEQKQQLEWGAQPQPEINLDDREFGKY